jgi:hypothetical protein
MQFRQVIIEDIVRLGSRLQQDWSDNGGDIVG